MSIQKRSILISILILFIIFGCGDTSKNVVTQNIVDIQYKSINIYKNNIWVRTTDAMDSSCTDIVTDKFDNHYIIGNVDGEYYDSFIIKIDKDGSKLWHKTISIGAVSGDLQSIEVDQNGFLYAVGSIKDYSGFNLSYNGYIIKFDQNGNKIWDKTIGGNNDDYFYAVTLSRNYLYAVGYSKSDDGDILDGNNGEADALIVKVDFSGNLVGHKTFGGREEDIFYEVETDLKDNLICVGYTRSSSRDITDGFYGIKDALIVKFDSTGNTLWHKTLGGSKGDLFNGVTIDNDLNIYAVGYTKSKDGDITSNNDPINGDALIIKLDSNGNKIWDKTIGGSKYDCFTRIFIDNTDIFYAIGYSYSNDGDIDGNIGDADALIVKIGNEDTLEWVKNFGYQYLDSFTGVTTDQNNNIYAVGYYIQTKDNYNPWNNPYTNSLIIKIIP